MGWTGHPLLCQLNRYFTSIDIPLLDSYHFVTVVITLSAQSARLQFRQPLALFSKP